MTTRRHKVEAWLGDDHGLTDAQIVDPAAGLGRAVAWLDSIEETER